MNTIKTLFIFIFILFLTNTTFGQENANIPQRTPEQEASKQTDKLQQELNLNTDQAKQVYEINLKYARERQVSNTRTQAMERMKNKNAEIEQVLNPEQNNRLQSKRYERSSYQNQEINRNQPPANASGFRSTQDNLRNTYRAKRPDYQPGTQQNNNLQRNSTTSPRYSKPQNNTQPTRNQNQTQSTPQRTETLTPPRRTETAPPPTYNTPRPQRNETSTPRKTEVPTRTNRN